MVGLGATQMHASFGLRNVANFPSKRASLNFVMAVSPTEYCHEVTMTGNQRALESAVEEPFPLLLPALAKHALNKEANDCSVREFCHCYKVLLHLWPS